MRAASSFSFHALASAAARRASSRRSANERSDSSCGSMSGCSILLERRKIGVSQSVFNLEEQRATDASKVTTFHPCEEPPLDFVLDHDFGRAGVRLAGVVAGIGDRLTDGSKSTVGNIASDGHYDFSC